MEIKKIEKSDLVLFPTIGGDKGESAMVQRI